MHTVYVDSPYHTALLSLWLPTCIVITAIIAAVLRKRLTWRGVVGTSLVWIAVIAVVVYVTGLNTQRYVIAVERHGYRVVGR